MPTIQINNKQIHVLEMNPESSETIVMIHGMFTNMSVFYFNIAPKLAERFHVVLYDLKGHGMSERSDRGYDLNTMSDDLVSLMDIMKLSKVNLVGYSYGGLIALKAALSYPTRINKLVIIESPKPDAGDAPEVLQKFGNEFIDQYLDNYVATTSLKPGRRQIEKNKQLFEYLFNHTSIKTDFDKDNDFFDQLVKNPIQNKSLLLYGKSSDCLPAGKYLSELMTNATFLIGEGNHNLPVQEPQWIAARINEFMK